MIYEHTRCVKDSIYQFIYTPKPQITNIFIRIKKYEKKTNPRTLDSNKKISKKKIIIKEWEKNKQPIMVNFKGFDSSKMSKSIK